MDRSPPHPTGTIVYYDGNSGAVVDRSPIETVPESMRFVYLKGGTAADSLAEADEAIPVVAVYRFTLDATNNLVPDDQAMFAVIEERGPDGRALRRTRMIKDPSET